MPEENEYETISVDGELYRGIEKYAEREGLSVKEAIEKILKIQIEKLKKGEITLP